MVKRRREGVNVDVQLVEIYEDLANENEEIRLKGALTLVSRFTTPNVSTKDEPKSKKGSDGEKDAEAPEVPARDPAELEKVFRRLFRGLCSGRKAARLGFSIALTELLSMTVGQEKESEIDGNVTHTLRVMESQTAVAAGATGQEERDYFFGRLFAAEAVIKSSILFKKGVSFDQWTNLLDMIFSLANKKPWLREECGWIVFRAIASDLVAQKVDTKYVEAAVQRLNANGLIQTPEAVAIWIAVRKVFPSAKLPKDVWKHDDPLLRSESVHLAKIMKEAIVSEGKEQKQQSGGAWNSKLHFAWDALISELIALETDDAVKSKSKKMKFAEFWTEIVDNNLFAAASSDERKYWGFLLFCKILQEAPMKIASQIFSKNLLRCLINQATAEDRYLHRVALRAAKAIQSRVAAEPAFALPAVQGLTGPSGAINFDQITKTKTVEKVLVESDEATLTSLVSLFEGLITTPGTTEAKAAISKRQYLADLLLNTVRARAAAAKEAGELKPDNYPRDVLDIFVKFAYFVPPVGRSSARQIPEPPVEQATRDTYQNRIMSCLTSLIVSDETPSELPFCVVQSILENGSNGELGDCVVELEGAVKASVKTAYKALKKIQSKSKSKSGSEVSGFQALQLLYSLTILQVYNGDGDAVTMLDELKTCYVKLAGKGQSDDDEEDVEASDILVEILLSFASKPSQLFRRMGQQVFGAFCSQITATGLQSLVSVLEAKESLAGQKEMFDEQNDDDEVEEEGSDVEMSDIEADSDVEVLDASDVEEIDGEVEEDDDDKSSASESDDDKEDDEEDDELAAFNAKLAEALGTGNDVGSDASDSDSDMDDDDMEALDLKLAEVFRAREASTTKKKDKKDAKETMVNFKNRVLDLLDIYVKKQPQTPLALDLLMPLLILIRTTTTKQIVDRAVGVVREYSRLCKGDKLPKEAAEVESESDNPDEDPEIHEISEPRAPAWYLLESIHEEALKPAPHNNAKPAHTAACSNASLLIARVLIAGQGESAVEDVVDRYAETRKRQLLDRKAQVGPGFWTEWNNWCNGVSGGRVLKGGDEPENGKAEGKKNKGKGRGKKSRK